MMTATTEVRLPSAPTRENPAYITATGSPHIQIPNIEEYRKAIAQICNILPKHVLFEMRTADMLYIYKDFCLNYRMGSGTDALGHFYIKDTSAGKAPTESPIIASFGMTSLRGCCAFAVSSGANVQYLYHHRGLGTLLYGLRLTIAKALGYGMMVSTDVKKNDVQMRIFKRFSATEILTHVNPRTSNNVGMFARVTQTFSPAMVEALYK